MKFEGDEGNEELAPTLSQGKRTIRTKSADPEIDSLYGKFKRGKLILQPHFQRLFVISNEEFVEAILIGTSEQGKVKKRFHLAEALVDDILQSYKKQPRCFSVQLKKELFDKDQTCLLCHQ